MFKLFKKYFKQNWKSLLNLCAGCLIWILIEENIIGLSYPAFGYLVFGGIQFNGTTDFLDTNNTFQSVFRGSFSISLWMKPDDGHPTNQGIVFGAQVTDHAAQIFLRPEGDGDSNDGKLDFGYVVDGNKGLNALTNVPVWANDESTWKYVVFVADSTVGGVGGKKIYVDGALVALDATENGSTSGVTFSNYTSTNSPYIGARHDRTDPVDNFFAGEITEVIFYDRALSADEIAALYDPHTKGMGDQVHSNDRVFDFRMDDGEDGTSANSDTVKDYSDNGNDGTVTGGIWKAEDVLSDAEEMEIIQGIITGNAGALLNGGPLYGNFRRILT